MKLAVFGKTGQLSLSLAGRIKEGPHEAVFYDRNDCNLAANPNEIRRFVTEMPAVDVVILAAAYTGVEQAEDDSEMAFAVNAHAPSAIADICKSRNIGLIYISTDYVFDGLEQIPYPPEFPTNPLNIYGQSKRAGEIAIIESGCVSSILRTSWLFDGSGRNFMTTMLKMEEGGRRIKVIGDQIGRPTYVGHLADAVLQAARAMHEHREEKTGLFHVTNTGNPVSWAGFARSIFEQSGTILKSPVIIDEILTKEYEEKVARPAYSVLDTSSFEKTFDINLPDWNIGLELALAEWRKD